MALERTKGVAVDVAEILPTLAMAALSKGDEATQELMKELVTDLLMERREKKARKEKQRLGAIQATKDAENQKSIEKKNCSHRNKAGGTRLRGQYLSGTHQLCLVCTWCGDEFHKPARDGQKVPPPELMPSGDVIGG
jgi:hypothetical protein